MPSRTLHVAAALCAWRPAAHGQPSSAIARRRELPAERAQAVIPARESFDSPHQALARPLPLEGGGRNAVQTGMMGNRIDREDG